MTQASEMKSTATTQQPPPLRISRVLHAPRETVFRAWSTAEHVKRWFCPATYTVPEARVEMRVDGAFDVCMRSPEGELHWTRGSFVEVTPHTRLVIDMHATDSAGKALTYHATGLPAGLSLGASTGLITGSPTHAGKPATTVTVTDASGSTAQAALTWNIAGRPTITGGLSVNAKGRPSLSLKVGAGTNAPPIQSIVVVPSRQVRFARKSRDLARGVTVRSAVRIIENGHSREKAQV